MSTQSFTKNYRDHSNDVGFQFEFFCDKCGNGHRSGFDASGVGVAASVLKAAGAFFGGGLSRAGWGADHVKDAFRGPAWDTAFKKAIEECKPSFRQCTRCGIWVCPEVCWNEARQLCERCAPDLAEEAASAQAHIAASQAADKMRNVDQVEGFDPKAEMLSSCPHCKSRLQAGAKFCATCGKPVGHTAAQKQFCTGCGTQLAAGAKFCSGCGTPSP
jgi:Double zinc ribbon